MARKKKSELYSADELTKELTNADCESLDMDTADSDDEISAVKYIGSSTSSAGDIIEESVPSADIDEANTRVSDVQSVNESGAEKKQRPRKNRIKRIAASEKGQIFASVPDISDISWDEEDQEITEDVEQAAIDALPHSEPDPALLMYDPDEIEDTHESAEDNAKYEAFLADYKEIMAKMLKEAKNAEPKNEDESDIYIVDDENEELDDEDELATEEEWINISTLTATNSTGAFDSQGDDLSDSYADNNEDDTDNGDEVANAEEITDTDESKDADEATADDEDEVADAEEIIDTDEAEVANEATADDEDEVADAEEIIDTDEAEDALENADSDVASEITAEGDGQPEETDENEEITAGDDIFDGEQIIIPDVSDGEEVATDGDFEDGEQLTIGDGISYFIENTDDSPSAEEDYEATESSVPEDEDDEDYPELIQEQFDLGEEKEENKKEDRGYDPNKPRFIDSVFEMLELFTFTFIAVMVITTFFLRHSIVDGGSMENTLFDGDVVIISDFMYTPSRGDIVVFEDYKVSRNAALIKRIIGVEGDTVRIDEDGSVYVNGEALAEDYVYEDFTVKYKAGEWKVGEGEVFVLGDHRNVSRDSEDFGPIRADGILGKVLFRLLPFESFGGVD